MPEVVAYYLWITRKTHFGIIVAENGQLKMIIYFFAVVTVSLLHIRHFSHDLMRLVPH